MAKEVASHKPTAKVEPKNYKWQRDKDREMVKGIFRFHEVPGGTMSFVFKKWKEDQVERFDLTDGQVYTIPLGVAKHLNTNCWYPEYEFIPGEGGTQRGLGGSMMKIGRKVPRCSFSSLEFVDIEDLTPSNSSPLVTVENVAGV